MDAGRDFETKIVVKVNAPDVLRRELAATRWKGDHIAMGTATDPYQRAEGRYRLMPRIIEALTECRNPFSILTKGTLILRDLDLLVRACEITDVSTAFSIGTLDEDAWRRTEPGPRIRAARLEAVAAFNAPASVLVLSRRSFRASPTRRRSCERSSPRRSTPARPRSRRSCSIFARASASSTSRGSRSTIPSWFRATADVPTAVRAAVRSQGAGGERRGIVRSAGGLRPREAVVETARSNRWRRPSTVAAEEQPTQLRML